MGSPRCCFQYQTSENSVTRNRWSGRRKERTYWSMEVCPSSVGMWGWMSTPASSGFEAMKRSMRVMAGVRFAGRSRRLKAPMKSFGLGLGFMVVMEVITFVAIAS